MIPIKDLKMRAVDLPLPICDLCNKQVDQISCSHTGLEMMWTVKCHGAEESFTIHDGVMIDAIGIEVGRAFVQNKLLEVDDATS